MELKIDINVEELVGKYRDRLNRAENMQPVMDLYAEELITIIDDSFEETTSPLGDIWDPLSDATIKNRRKGKGSDPDRPLVDTAMLRAALTVEGERLALAFGVSGDSAKYAGTQQFGRDEQKSANYYTVKSYERKSYTRNDGKKIPATTVKSHHRRGLPYGGADIPARGFLPASIIGDRPMPDFSKGEAKEFYERFKNAIKVWIVDGRLE